MQSDDIHAEDGLRVSQLENQLTSPGDDGRFAHHENTIIVNPYEPSTDLNGDVSPDENVSQETMLSILGHAFLWLVLVVISFFCVVDLIVTWGDAKGGASGNLPPVLTVGDRISRSFVPGGVLLLGWGAMLYDAMRSTRRR